MAEWVEESEKYFIIRKGEEALIGELLENGKKGRGKRDSPLWLIKNPGKYKKWPGLDVYIGRIYVPPPEDPTKEHHKPKIFNLEGALMES